MEINQSLGVLIKFLVSDFVDLISAVLLQDINSSVFTVLVFLLKTILQEFPLNPLAVICKVEKGKKFVLVWIAHIVIWGDENREWILHITQWLFLSKLLKHHYSKLKGEQSSSNVYMLEYTVF